VLLGKKKKGKKKKEKKVKVVRQEDVKYICDSCGHIGKRKLLEKISYIFVHIILICGITGFAFIVFLLLSTGYPKLDGPANIVPVYIQTLRYKAAYENNFDLKLLMVDSVLNCTDDEECIIFGLANELNNITTYIPQSFNILQNPLNSLELGGGDCEDLSVLLVGALRQFGITSFVDCNMKFHHCIVVVYPFGRDYYYAIDLARQNGKLRYEKLTEGLDPWDYIVWDEPIKKKTFNST